MTRAPRGRGAVRGMSLVDLMVGVTIGLFMVAVMGAVYQGSKTTFVAQESGSRIQENGRYAIETLSNDLRMSGFRGCRNSVAVNNTLKTPTALQYNFAQPVWASRSVGGEWTPALSAPLSDASPATAGDVLVLRRPTGTAWSLIGEMASTSAALAITPTAAFTSGDLLMVADCASADVLQATNATPGTSGSIAHVAGAAGISPGVTASTLSRVYAQDARVWRLQTVMYYLADSVRHSGQLALWSYTSPVYDGSDAKAELVSGVERMAITFGVDTNGDNAVDRFYYPHDLPSAAQVLTARIELVVAAADATQGATTAQPYVFNGSTITPTDTRMRAVMSTTVSLRNAVP